jgi:spermidine synthase
MTQLFSTQELLTRLNAGTLSDPRVAIVNADAFLWLKANRERFDLIVADFPDPSSFSIGKLYSTAFFERVRAALGSDGTFVVQCSSPYVARRSFWCIDATLRAVGFATAPYHAYVPTFGEWGYILASAALPESEPRLPAGLRFVTRDNLAQLFDFPPDMSAVPVEVNRLNNQALVRYFEAEWAAYAH